MQWLEGGRTHEALDLALLEDTAAADMYARLNDTIDVDEKRLLDAVAFLRHVCEMGVYACVDVPMSHAEAANEGEKNREVEETLQRLFEPRNTLGLTARYLQEDVFTKTWRLQQRTDPTMRVRLLGTYRLLTLCGRIANRVHMYIRLRQPELRAVVTGTLDRDFTAILESVTVARPTLCTEAVELETIMQDPEVCEDNAKAHRAVRKWLRRHHYDEASDIANGVAWHQRHLTSLLNGSKRGFHDSM